ncbi:MAG: bifunctional tetrahydrofolate synthase/dihydrofolate synthase [Gammaproteobacteria bacterium]|nr:bifunctional tetrahydrofolate synthase/dihydrofolate synthase [Gammaproteobacteria bacterium]
MSKRSLAQWLQWQSQLHPKNIELGLDRIGRVYGALGSPRPAPRVISVAGTNGKGSSGAMLESICRVAGQRTGLYSSPHLLRYNERIRLLGAEVTDADLCRVFESIDAAREGTSLTYFEFGTLAALLLMAESELDLAILEVGLGGRFDAVNLIDADVALITSIGLDHCDWLGPDRASIGREKAGIARRSRPLVCSDPAPPDSLGDSARAIGAELHGLGRDYGFRESGESWSWFGWGRQIDSLPRPALSGPHQLRNAAGVLAGLALLEMLPPSEILARGLKQVELPGRMQRLPGLSEILLDVGHNPDAANAVAETLRAKPVKGRTLALFGTLADKDCPGILAPLSGLIDQWFLLDTRGLVSDRGVATAAAADYLLANRGSSTDLISYADLNTAWCEVTARLGPDDRLVVFGCFALIAGVLALVAPGDKSN